MKVAVSFTNLGPYHLARLRALGAALSARGGALTVVETAGREARYPWLTAAHAEPFERVTLFPNRELEALGRTDCQDSMRVALDELTPDVVAVAGYVRPECMAALRWGERRGVPVLLMSESQEIDRPRAWWSEAIKKRRVRRFASALVGGVRHQDYLETLGMPATAIALGYNAVDHDRIVNAIDGLRSAPDRPTVLPPAPYFLTVCRLAPEKNLSRLIRAYAQYRASAGADARWRLVICGEGPCKAELTALCMSLGVRDDVIFAGFQQECELDAFYAFASAFVLASVSEPWGLVANEAAASALPLLISDRAGCVETLVPADGDPAGIRMNPLDLQSMSRGLRAIASLSVPERIAMGSRAREIAAMWAPSRFARGFIEAIELGRMRSGSRRRKHVRTTSWK